MSDHMAAGYRPPQLPRWSFGGCGGEQDGRTANRFPSELMVCEGRAGKAVGKTSNIHNPHWDNVIAV